MDRSDPVQVVRFDLERRAEEARLRLEDLEIREALLVVSLVVYE